MFNIRRDYSSFLRCSPTTEAPAPCGDDSCQQRVGETALVTLKGGNSDLQSPVKFALNPSDLNRSDSLSSLGEGSPRSRSSSVPTPSNLIQSPSLQQQKEDKKLKGLLILYNEVRNLRKSLDGL